MRHPGSPRKPRCLPSPPAQAPRLNFLSNIIRYFSSSNLPSMTMMIKLLVLLSEVVAWLKKKSNKPFQFQYKTGMRELILVPHFRFPSLFSSHTSS